ncbi:uncharacterized protein [Eleutherodactylus coqui]|uniref:uncharacterized protein n=1 Tax=Eleutherodactylus coqui TaxID=57060 RepID=UPI003462F587
MEPLASSLRLRSGGGRVESQEGRRASRGSSNVTPTPRLDTESRRTRSQAKEKQVSAKKQPISWGERQKGESVEELASRIATHMRDYEEAGKELVKQRRELQAARCDMERASRGKKVAISQKIKICEEAIEMYEEERERILETSGPFREKLLNDRRFSQMAARSPGSRKTARKYQPSSTEESEALEGRAACSAEQQSSLQPGTGTSIPAEQIGLPSSSDDSDGSEYGSSSSGQGALLLQQIMLQESPARMQAMHFGDELPPETAAGGKKAKKKKNQAYIQERDPPDG